MRKEKNTSGSKESLGQSEKHTPVLKVVESTNSQAQVVFEIQRHVRSIRALIRKLHPMERQRYFDGLLNHLLSEPVNYPITKADMKKTPSNDFSNLSDSELSLIRELSVKIEELYRNSENELSN